MKDNFVPNWEGCICPVCNKGVLGPLSTRSQREIKAYRCNKKNCQKFVNPLHLHPIFTLVRGPEGHSLQVQAAALLLRLAGVSLSTIHLLTNINHKAVERMNHNLNLVRSGHVTKVEKSIMFGGAPKAWKDVEVDEACFDKRTLKPWEQSEEDAKQGKTRYGNNGEAWCSVAIRKARCCSSFPATTVPRAPGPQIRSAQYEYWHRNEDLWVCAGQLLEECMRTIVTNPGAEQSNARALHSIILSTAETTTVQLASRPQPLYC